MVPCNTHSLLPLVPVVPLGWKDSSLWALHATTHLTPSPTEKERWRLGPTYMHYSAWRLLLLPVPAARYRNLTRPSPH